MRSKGQGALTLKHRSSPTDSTRQLDFLLNARRRSVPRPHVAFQWRVVLGTWCERSSRLQHRGTTRPRNPGRQKQYFFLERVHKAGSRKLTDGLSMGFWGWLQGKPPKKRPTHFVDFPNTPCGRGRHFRMHQGRPVLGQFQGLRAFAGQGAAGICQSRTPQRWGFFYGPFWISFNRHPPRKSAGLSKLTSSHHLPRAGL